MEQTRNAAIDMAFAGCGKIPDGGTLLRDAQHVLSASRKGVDGLVDAMCRRGSKIQHPLTGEQLAALMALIEQAAEANEKRAAERIAAQKRVFQRMHDGQRSEELDNPTIEVINLGLRSRKALKKCTDKEISAYIDRCEQDAQRCRQYLEQRQKKQRKKAKQP